VIDSTVHTHHHKSGKQSPFSSPIPFFGKGTLYPPGSESNLPSRNQFSKHRRLPADSQKSEYKQAGIQRRGIRARLKQTGSALESAKYLMQANLPSFSEGTGKI